MPNSTKAGLRPDLYEVLTAVRARPGEATYYYRNVLAGQGHRDLRTATVLRRLRRLEALGKVRLARTNYAVMLAWEPASDVDALSRARASGIQVNEGGGDGRA